jgi:hypothetical protein
MLTNTNQTPLPVKNNSINSIKKNANANTNGKTMLRQLPPDVMRIIGAQASELALVDKESNQVLAPLLEAQKEASKEWLASCFDRMIQVLLECKPHDPNDEDRESGIEIRVEFNMVYKSEKTLRSIRMSMYKMYDSAMKPTDLYLYLYATRMNMRDKDNGSIFYPHNMKQKWSLYPFGPVKHIYTDKNGSVMQLSPKQIRTDITQPIADTFFVDNDIGPSTITAENCILNPTNWNEIAYDNTIWQWLLAKYTANQAVDMATCLENLSNIKNGFYVGILVVPPLNSRSEVYPRIQQDMTSPFLPTIKKTGGSKATSRKPTSRTATGSKATGSKATGSKATGSKATGSKVATQQVQVQINVLGRKRNVVMRGRVKYAMYKGVLVKLSDLLLKAKRVGNC